MDIDKLTSTEAQHLARHHADDITPREAFEVLSLHHPVLDVNETGFLIYRWASQPDGKWHIGQQFKSLVQAIQGESNESASAS